MMPPVRRHALAKALLDRNANAPLALFGDTSDAAVARVLLNEARELICTALDLASGEKVNALIHGAWRLVVQAMEVLENEG